MKVYSMYTRKTAFSKKPESHTSRKQGDDEAHSAFVEAYNQGNDDTWYVFSAMVTASR